MNYTGMYRLAGNAFCLSHSETGLLKSHFFTGRDVTTSFFSFTLEQGQFFAIIRNYSGSRLGANLRSPDNNNVNIFVVYCLEQDSYFYHYNLERSHKFISLFLPEQIESLKDTGSGVPQGVLRDGGNPQKPSLP